MPSTMLARRSIVSNRSMQERTFGLGAQGDLVEIWRQAVQGNAAARRALLRRILPASTSGALAPVFNIAGRATSRRPDRAAA
jgi:hypothetical protein